MSSTTLYPELSDPAPRPVADGGSVPVSDRPRRLGTLRALFRRHYGRLLLTYGLFNLENLLALVQPLALGLAINDLLQGSSRGLYLFVLQHFAHLLIGALRRRYDVRVFAGIYADLATRVVVEQRRRQVEVTRIAARSDLSRAFVDFFQRDVPVVLYALYSLVGGLVMLGLYDGLLVPCCLVLVVPAGLLNVVYGRKALVLNGRLHDEYEREIGVIDRGRAEEVRGHYGWVAHWLIKLSDWEALNYGVMDLFTLGLTAVALVRFCTLPGATAGSILAVFRYVLMFTTGLDGVPMMVRQFSRLRDIGRRMELPPVPEAAPAPGGDRQD